MEINAGPAFHNNKNEIAAATAEARRNIGAIRLVSHKYESEIVRQTMADINGSISALKRQNVMKVWSLSEYRVILLVR